VPISKRVSLSAEYRYWSSLEFKMTSETGDPVKTRYAGHMANLNVIYQFLDGADAKVSVNTAAAFPGSGWYVDFKLGAAAAGDSDINDGLIDTNFDAFDVGGASTIATGYSRVRPSGHRLRAELELAYWQNDADLIDFGPLAGEFRLSGDVKVRGIAANFLYDFGAVSNVKPYAGFGLGYANLDYDILIKVDGETNRYLRDDYSGLAVQALFGVGVPLARKLEASLNYRYWLAPSVKLQTPSGGTLKTEHAVHSLMLGIRYQIGG
jgi:opacity protein-like surface antigen